MVAKTYQTWSICGEPYSVNGKKYVDVQKTEGSPVKKVRWYSDSEYAKMYNIPISVEDIHFSQRKCLGFDPYIWVFKGDTYSALEWFRQSPARYNELFGWYFPAAIDLPDDTPECVEPFKLDWSLVGKDDDNLKGRKEIQSILGEILYAADGEFVGKIGDKVDIYVEVERAHDFEGYYGTTTIHTLRGEDGNVYVWKTAAKHWEVGDAYHITGTIKEYTTYKGIRQNVLTRCRVIA